MYKCSMCKIRHDGEPAFVNACGKFCASCKAKIHERAAEGTRKQSLKFNGRCIWCGEMITEETKQPRANNSDNVCQPCALRRDWLLNAIRLSDRPAKYVAHREERERPMREERQRVIEATQQEKPAIAVAEPSETEARLMRLEKMLNKLTSALGV